MYPLNFITLYAIPTSEPVEHSCDYPAMLQSISKEDTGEKLQSPVYNGLDLDDVEQNRDLFKSHKNAAVDIVRNREKDASKAQKRLTAELNKKQTRK